MSDDVEMADLIRSAKERLAEVVSIRAQIVDLKASADRDRSDLIAAKAKADAETAQISQLHTAISAARSTIEQEKDRAVAAAANLTALITQAEESKTKIGNFVLELQGELQKALETNRAAVAAREGAEQAKASSESSKLQAEAERDKSGEASRAAQKAKTDVEGILNASTLINGQLETAKSAVLNTQKLTAELTAKIADAVSLSETELGKIKACVSSCEKAKADLETSCEQGTLALKDLSTLKTAAESAQLQAEEAATTAKTHSEAAAREAKSASEAHNLSTTVGLAGAFNIKAKKNNWREWVWTGSLLLSLAAILGIGIWRYHDLSQLIGKTSDIRILATQIALAIFGVSGPIWLAWISTGMLQRNFALTEDYAYKAALAQAYVGFKDQAKQLDPIFLRTSVCCSYYAIRC